MKYAQAVRSKPLPALAGLVIAVVLALAVICFAAEPTASVTSDEALKELTEGNARFVSGNRNSLHVAKRRTEVAKDQKPFAVVLACADSRVAPELVFDQGLGDIFVIRTAGEVIDLAAIGSIEYAVGHLGVPLILVVGHQGCGAVAAAVADAKEPGHIADLLKAIQPAVAATKGKPGDAVENAVHEQAIAVAKQLQTTAPIISESFKSGKLQILAGCYSLDSGKVELLKP